MITGIENFSPKLQKAILSCISSLFDMSEDVEVEEYDDNIIQINDTKFYVIDDYEQQLKIHRYNSDRMLVFFDGVTQEQYKYIDEDEWLEKNGIQTFEEWLEENTKWSVDDCDYYGSYNFYEIH